MLEFLLAILVTDVGLITWSVCYLETIRSIRHDRSAPLRTFPATSKDLKHVARGPQAAIDDKIINTCNNLLIGLGKNTINAVKWQVSSQN